MSLSEGKEVKMPAANTRYSWGWGRTKPEVGEVQAWRHFPWTLLAATAIGVPSWIVFFYI